MRYFFLPYLRTITLHLIVSGLFLSILVMPARAQTIEDLEARVQSLLQAVTSLQTHITALEGETTIAATPTVFAKNLSVGSRGEDVKILQQILNQNEKTRLALSGPGSPGNETDYFGSLTQRAVIMFQNLFAQEILLPVGLSQGTGFVGPSTRKKLNDILSPEKFVTESEKNPAEIAAEDQETLEGIEEDTLSASEELIAAFVSPSFGPPGTQPVFEGSGFAETNTVWFDDLYAIRNVFSPNGTRLQFTVPDTLPFGKYSLSIANTSGTTTENVFFIITNPTAASPVINKTTPASGPPGTEVTITGSNFGAVGNNIYTSYGIVENVPSFDKQTLTFTISPPPEALSYQSASGTPIHFDLPVWFYVVNTSGISQRSNPGVFFLNI